MYVVKKELVKKVRLSRVLTSQGGATVSGTDDVRVRLIGRPPAPGIDDLNRPFRKTEPTSHRRLFHPRGERSSSLGRLPIGLTGFVPESKPITNRLQVANLSPWACGPRKFMKPREMRLSGALRGARRTRLIGASP